MKYRATKHKRAAIDNKNVKNQSNLNNKKVSKIDLKPFDELFNIPKSVFNFEWIESLNTDFIGAATQILDLELPQKANYNFSIDLDITEEYLPFLHIDILSKLNINQPDRKIKGVEKFVYSGLREISVKIYDWLGVTQITAGMGNFGGFTGIPLASPQVSLPTYSLDTPSPEACYTKAVYWTLVSFPLIGSGINNIPTSPDGTILWPDTIDEITLLQYTQNLADTWLIDSTSVVFSASQSATFKHQIFDFPVPFDTEEDTFLLPCASEDPLEFSDETYTSQYWELSDITDFQGLIDVYGYTYQEAVDLLSAYYTDIYITPENLGPPYKIYRIIDNEVVESGQKTVKITKLSDTTFSFDISGYLLLIASSNVVTEFSDPNFPTYKPSSDPIFISLRIYFKDHPVTEKQHTTYAY